MLKKIIAGSLILFVTAVFARSDYVYLDAQQVANGPQGKQRLSGIAYFMKGQNHPAVVQELGEVHSSKKTRNLGRGDEESCEIALVSALIAIEKKAKSMGADAVINMESYTRDKISADTTKLECNVGSAVANMAVRGTMVKFQK